MDFLNLIMKFFLLKITFHFYSNYIPGNTDFYLLTSLETKFNKKKQLDRKIAVYNQNKFRKQTKNISF